jgi:hypothetical protein
MTDADERRGITRRNLMKTVGVGVGAGAVGLGTTGLDDGPVGEAEAVVPLGVGAAAGVGYLVYKGAETFLGNSQDHSDYTGADALHTAIYEDGKEMASADERVMTSIKNNITHSRNVALPKGKSAAIEKMNKGAPESEAVTAMQDAVNGYFATIQQNILTHWNAQQEQAHSMVLDVENHENLSLSTVFELTGTSDSLQASNMVASDDIPLVDGSMAEMKTLSVDTGTSMFFNGLFRPAVDNSDFTGIAVISPQDGSTQNIAYPDSFSTKTNAPDEYSSGDVDPWSEVLRTRDSVIDNLSGFVSDVYSYYDKSEIPTDKLMDPVTAATELQQDYDGYQTAGVHAAMLGIPSQTARSLYLELHDAGVRVYADIYTEHVPEDSNGNEIGFKQGVRYSPSEWEEPLYVAYEIAETRTATSTATDSGTTAPTATSTATATATATATDDPLGTGEMTTTDDGWTSDGSNVGVTDFAQIEQDFTIRHAENKDGEPIDTFQTESDNTQTTDISKLEEELAKIRAIQRQMQEDAQEGGGGGGGGLGSDIPAVGVLAGAAAILGLGAAANQGGRR